MSSITFAIFTNAKHHAFATYTIARNCKYRQHFTNPTETTHFPHISKKNQQRLINDYISSITSCGNKFFTAFKISKKPYVPITRYSFQKRQHLKSNLILDMPLYNSLNIQTLQKQPLMALWVCPVKKSTSVIVELQKR